jgi:hypothetical protein
MARASSVAVGRGVLDGAVVGTLVAVDIVVAVDSVVSVEITSANFVSVGITVSIVGLGETSATAVSVISGVDVDGLKTATGTLQVQQSKNKPAHPIASLPLSFCLPNHEGNRRIVCIEISDVFIFRP